MANDIDTYMIYSGEILLGTFGPNSSRDLSRGFPANVLHNFEAVNFSSRSGFGCLIRLIGQSRSDEFFSDVTDDFLTFPLALNLTQLKQRFTCTISSFQLLGVFIISVA